MGVLEASFGTAPVLAAAFDSGAAAAGLSAAVEGPLAGRDGATFTPSVSEDGTLSWTNDKGLENPEPVNIMGPQGPAGADGEKGEKGEAGEVDYSCLNDYLPLTGGELSGDLTVEEKVVLRATDDDRGNVQVLAADGGVSVNIYANTGGNGEVDVHDSEGSAKAALYVSDAGDGKLKLKNAGGEEVSLTMADILRLRGLTDKLKWVLRATVDFNSVESYVCQWTGICRMGFRSNWDGAGYGFIKSSEGSLLAAETWTTNTYMYDVCPCVKGETWTRDAWSNVTECPVTFYELQITE